VSKAAAIAAAAPAVALAFTSIPARAYQGNMEHALAALQEAFGALQRRRRTRAVIGSTRWI
jgi:hypothetical protein